MKLSLKLFTNEIIIRIIIQIKLSLINYYNEIIIKIIYK